MYFGTLLFARTHEASLPLSVKIYLMQPLNNRHVSSVVSGEILSTSIDIAASCEQRSEEVENQGSHL